MCALNEEGLCGLGRVRVEGEVLGDEHHMGGEGGVNVHVESCVGLVFGSLVGSEGREESCILGWALVVESGAGGVRREKAAA